MTTPLHAAVFKDDVKAVRIFLNAETFDINPMNNDYQTPLFLVQSLEVADLLVKAGANTEFTDLGLRTAFDYANASKRRHIAKSLMSLSDRFKLFKVRFSSCLLGMQSIRLTVTRANIFELSLKSFLKGGLWTFPEGRLAVTFHEERAFDGGGLTREWATLLLERMFIGRKSHETDLAALSSLIDEQTQGHVAISSDASLAAAFSQAVNDATNPAPELSVVQETVDASFDGQAALALDNLLAQSLMMEMVNETEELQQATFSNDPRLIPEKSFQKPLFQLIDENSQFYRFSPDFDGPREVAIKFAGVAIARIFRFNLATIGANLAPSLLKTITGEAICFQDLAVEDPSLHQHLQDVLNGKYDLTKIPLYFPDSEGKRVTDDNVQEYADAIARDALYSKNFADYREFSIGFHSIISQHDMCAYFAAEELGKIFQGESKVNRINFHSIVQFPDPVWQSKKELFWSAIEFLTDDELFQLVNCITGLAGLPFGGIINIREEIKIVDYKKYLPRTSTCFYMLKLPIDIDTVDELLRRVRILLLSPKEFFDPNALLFNDCAAEADV